MTVLSQSRTGSKVYLEYIIGFPEKIKGTVYNQLINVFFCLKREFNERETAFLK